MEKKIEEYTLAEIIHHKKTDEAVSYLSWLEYEQRKTQLSGMTLKEIVDARLHNEACDLIDTILFEKRNDHMTPRSAFEAIKDFIPRGVPIWEPFTKSDHANIKSPTFLRDMGFQVTASGEDFFSCSYPNHVVVSNPPYVNNVFENGKGGDNMKVRVIRRLIKLQIPFMLLMPIVFINTHVLRTIADEYGDFQYIFPRGRIKFSYFQDGEEKYHNIPLFNTIWYCWRINLPKDAVFL